MVRFSPSPRRRIYVDPVTTRWRQGTLRKIKQLKTYDDPAIAAAFQRGAATRASHLGVPTARMLELARIGTGHRVLVLGAGTGDEALAAAARVGSTGEVVATDVSAAMIAEAARSVADARAANVRCLVMDAQHLEFSPGSFDAVISRNALMYVPELEVALAEAYRVLKSHGWFAATVWGSGGRNPRLSDPIKAARALGADVQPAAHYRIAVRLGSPRLLRAALREADFSEVIIEPWPVVSRAGNLDEAMGLVMDHPGTRELVKLLSGDSERRMRHSLTRRWQKYAAPGGVEMPGEQLVAAGTK